MMVIEAAIATGIGSVAGASGALYPAWRASRLDPYDLVSGEG